MILASKFNEFQVPGKNIQVNVRMPLDRKELGTQSSDSSSANAGVKPQRISVSTIIPFENASNLTKLVDVARSCDADDEPTVYVVSDDICSAMNIREVIFSGDLSVKKASNILAYCVSFELLEKNSVSERRENNSQTAKNINHANVSTADLKTAEQMKYNEQSLNVSTTNVATINTIAKSTNNEIPQAIIN